MSLFLIRKSKNDRAMRRNMLFMDPVWAVEATSKSCLVQLFIAVFLFLIRKSKNDRAIRRNMLFMDPVWDSFPFYMRTVQSQTGTKVIRVGSATDTKSGRSEFTFKPVPCKRMKRNVWRLIPTHTGLNTGLNSSRSHVITPTLPQAWSIKM